MQKSSPLQWWKKACERNQAPKVFLSPLFTSTAILNPQNLAYNYQQTNHENVSVGVKNHACCTDMLGYFFQFFFFGGGWKKYPTMFIGLFWNIFFIIKKKKSWKNIPLKYDEHTWFFFSRFFIFFLKKKKTTHVLRHAWFFSTFFSSFDVFQACSSDMHVFQACSSDMRGNFCCFKNQKLELPRVKSSSYSRLERPNENSLY